MVLVAAEAIRAVRTVARGYAEERERQAELQEQRRAEGEQVRQASLAARRAYADEIAGDESRLRRLISAREFLADQVGTEAPAAADLPARPATDDIAALTDYHQTVLTRIAALTQSIAEASRHAGSISAADLAAMVATAPGLDERLRAFEAQARSSRQVPADVAAARRAQLQRILAHLTLIETTSLPEDLESLAAEYMRTLSAERAEALATELRLGVARHNERATAEAAAVVLEQSLRDLGYEVEGIGETLFVEGGVAHFQKPGWDDYFVRLRIDAGRSAVNFNVVRPGAPGEDRRQEDTLAEERWCAEFPKLQQTLAARGLDVAVTRMLAAGEVPVQVVDAATLPKHAPQDERRATTTPKALQRS